MQTNLPRKAISRRPKRVGPTEASVQITHKLIAITWLKERKTDASSVLDKKKNRARVSVDGEAEVLSHEETETDTKTALVINEVSKENSPLSVILPTPQGTCGV